MRSSIAHTISVFDYSHGSSVVSTIFLGDHAEAGLYVSGSDAKNVIQDGSHHHHGKLKREGVHWRCPLDAGEKN